MAYATIAGLPDSGGPLHGLRAPHYLCGARDVAPAERQHDHDDACDLDRRRSLAKLVPNGDAATLLQVTALLTLMVGGMLIVASALRLGFVANFISEPVLVGFKAGIGVVIIVDQLPKILGIHFAKGSFLHNVQSIGLGLSQCRWPRWRWVSRPWSVLAAIEKFRPRWPAPLIAVARRHRGRWLVRLAEPWR